MKLPKLYDFEEYAQKEASFTCQYEFSYWNLTASLSFTV